MLENVDFLRFGGEAFVKLAQEFRELSDTLGRLAGIADSRTASRAAALKARLEGFSAKITLVGQVKAGKSALANILAGTPGLLPSDVNPWTSVVTTLAINGRAPADPSGPAETRARFTFFNRAEWDNLVVHGGRLGELAERAGAEEELQEVARQVEAMRRMTEARLGKHFEQLLGQSHSYGYVDAELVERYVCLGDDPAHQAGGAEAGRFADITRSAEFYIEVPQYPLAVTLSDTPGVNDTFMMREQTTLRSLRGSELCVVVLSAHQALSTVDLALLRLIANLENRQIILFVNRVDELSRPAEQIGEIRETILETLQASRIGRDVALVFGSAKWAEAALTASMEGLSADSRAALAALAEAAPERRGADEWETAWTLSGIPELMAALAARVAEGSGRRQLERTRLSARNLTNEARARQLARRRSATAVDLDLGGRSAEAAMSELAERFEGEVAALCESLRADLVQRMRTAEAGFVKRATDALVVHLEEHGEQGSWHYDPAGLRVLQRTAYTSFARTLSARAGALYAEAAAHVQGVYVAVLGEQPADFCIEAPLAPRAPAPVGLGRTIALDLQSTWWRRWWQKRRGVESFAKDYAHLIRAEVHSITRDIEDNPVAAALEEAQAILRDFLAEHRETIARIAGSGGAGEEPAGLGAAPDTTTTFSEILKGLEDMAA